MKRRVKLFFISTCERCKATNRAQIPDDQSCLPPFYFWLGVTPPFLHFILFGGIYKTCETTYKEEYRRKEKEKIGKYFRNTVRIEKRVNFKLELNIK